MRDMRFVAGVLAGMVVGAFLATAVGASAVSFHWYSAGDILSKNRSLQYGYIAGVYDAITKARDSLEYGNHKYPNDEGLQVALIVFNSYLACMNTHGNTLGPFTDWAVLQWTSTSDGDRSAAAVVLDGCPLPTP